MAINKRQIIGSAILLGSFAILGTGIVAYVHENTRMRIIANQEEALLRSLHEIIPDDAYDNDILQDSIQFDSTLLNGNLPVTVYRARHKEAPIAAVLTVTAPDGYNGPIRLLVGIHYDATLAGVRVVSHRETPGLGDPIESRRSDWILGFAGRSLENPVLERWSVKRDGGEFDQFTGATISPRAVVRAVRNSLVYFSDHKDELFDMASPPTESSTKNEK